LKKIFSQKDLPGIYGKGRELPSSVNPHCARLEGKRKGGNLHINSHRGEASAFLVRKTGEEKGGGN